MRLTSASPRPSPPSAVERAPGLREQVEDMRPEFGCRVHEHVFAPANAATAGAISADVRSSLEQWEPRIDVGDVLVSYDDTEPGTLYIDVGYQIRGFNDPRNLVFPFYLIPDDEGSGPRSGDIR